MMQSVLSKSLIGFVARFKNVGFTIACVFLLAACSEKSLDAPEKPMLISLMTHVAQGEQDAVEKMVLVAEDGDKIYQEVARYLRGSFSNMPAIKDVLVKSRKELGDGTLVIRLQVITDPASSEQSITVTFRKHADGTDRIESVRIAQDEK